MVLISLRNRSAADHGGELRAEDLDGDGAIVLEVVREVDGGHAARAELALDAVAVGEGVREGRRDGRHLAGPREAKLGSTAGDKMIKGA